MDGERRADGATRAEEVILARLRRPWGRRGELLVELCTDWPHERLGEGRELVLAWRDGRRRAMRSAGLVERPPGPALRIEGVEDIGAAERLGGAEIVGPREAEGLALEPDEVHGADLPGLEVRVVGSGRVGRVRALVEGVGRDLVEVELDAGGSALVPLAPRIVTRIEVEQGFLELDPPLGLLDPEEALDAGGERP